MSDRMFGNDPDVMILRNSKNKLTLHERYTLCVLNNILGSLVFSSDNVYLYSKQEHLLYAATFPKVEPFVKSVLEFRKNCFIIRFTVKHTFGCCSYTTYSNLTSEEQTVYLPESSKETHILSAVDMDMHIAQSNQSKVVFYHPSSDIKLKTHETKTFLHIPKNDGLSFLGGVGHIVPGVDVDTLERKGEEIRVKFRKENSRRHKICFALGEYLFNKRCSEPPVCRFNGYLIKHDWVSVKGSGEGREKSEVLLFCLEEY
ncbi:hypothetical protein BY458DRAFT_354882 [Sporodiniella umbellata]|nr:hypothetical protein BY458DRAFT_354882 [Sporodiniella umbellata]